MANYLVVVWHLQFYFYTLVTLCDMGYVCGLHDIT